MPIERTIPVAAAVHRSAKAGLLALAMAALPGCEARSRYETAHLAGAVSIDGDWVPHGKLVLLPLGSGQGPALGATITDGHYDFPRAPLGKSLVQIYANRPTGKVEKVMGAEIAEVVDTVPEKYRQGIEIEVFGDNLRQDFALESWSDLDPRSAAAP